MSELRRSKRKSGTRDTLTKTDAVVNCKKLKTNELEQEKNEFDTKLNQICARNSVTHNSGTSSSDEDFQCPASIPKSQSKLPSSHRNSSPLLDFSSIEKNIFSGVTRLSDSDSDSDFEEVPNQSNGFSHVSGDTVVTNHGGAASKDVENTSSCSGSKSEVSKLKKGFKKSSFQGNCSADVENSGLCVSSPVTNGKRQSGRSANKARNSGLKSGKESADTKTLVKAEKSPIKSTSKSHLAVKEVSNERNEEKLERSCSRSSRQGSVKGSDAIKSNKPQRSSLSVSKTNLPHTSRKKKSDKQINTPEIKKEIPEKIDNLDVSALLALGEGLKEHSVSPQPSDSDDDWEEVKGPQANEHAFPKGGVEITVEMPDLFHRRKRRDELDCMRAEVNRNFNRARRELQLLFHKVSLLGWLAHGIYVNNVLNSDHLKALSMSLMPKELFLTSGKIDKKYILEIIKWFNRTMECTEGFHVTESKLLKPLHESLSQQFSRKVARSFKEQVFMFVCSLRALGIDARLIMSCQPMQLKPPSRDLLPINPKSEPKKLESKSKNISKEGGLSEAPKKSEKKSLVLNSLSSSVEFETKLSSSTKKSPSTSLKEKIPAKRKTSLESPSTKSLQPLRRSRTRTAQKSYVESSEEEEVISPKQQPILDPNNQKSISPENKERLKAAAAKRTRGSKRFTVSVNDAPEQSSHANKNCSRKRFQSSEKALKNSKPSTSSHKGSQESLSDSDFEPKRQKVTQTSRRKSTPCKKKRSTSRGKGMKVLSTDEDVDVAESSSGADYWVEVYLETEERWVPIDISSGKVDSVKGILAKAGQPISYVLACNANKTLKDVTKRYSPKFSQVTAKLRVSVDWWERTLRSWKPKRTQREIHEDSEMNMVELDRPIPTKIGECKNHPLYALKRHLLKFEAIYPPDAPTLGFIQNGEAIYARQNVYTLHSREMWIKEAKVVRLGEKPYKIVKARPKWDKLSGKVINDLALEVFGPWQVEDYVPPPAVDGKVPRNAYGNVELFKPTMLPKGCAHLQVPGLNRVAKKLKIDCAPAVVGFDYHSGGCHPTYDGFVVCEEFVDVLMDAWNRDIDESAKRREEKHEKRVYGNWKRLIKGLLIREHLKHRYDFKEESGDGGAGPSQSKVNSEALKSARISEGELPPAHSLFPKLMARMRSFKRSSHSEKRNTPSAKPQAGKKNSKVKAKKKKSETSEEEETDWESSSTSGDESEMVLLSDRDSDSESE